MGLDRDGDGEHNTHRQHDVDGRDVAAAAAAADFDDDAAILNDEAVAAELNCCGDFCHPCLAENNESICHISEENSQQNRPSS
jgi:hypothetical protein